MTKTTAALFGLTIAAGCAIAASPRPAPRPSSAAPPPSAAPSGAGLSPTPEVAPVEALRIEWVTLEECKPGYPTWVHYYGDNCAPCKRQEATFTDPAVIKQSKAWNCVKVKVADGSPVPRDEFASPSTMPNGKRLRITGWPQNYTAKDMAARLYKYWRSAMERSVVRPRPVARLLNGR